MNNVKKYLALVMAVLMIVCAVPFGVFATCDHEYESVPAKAATCTDPGHNEGVKCTKCGTVLSGLEVIPAKGHKWVAGTPVKVTCTKEGYTPYTCSVCGETKKENVIPAVGHHDYKLKDSTDPTCSKTGSKKFECSVCGDNYIETVPAKGHTYVTTVVAATCLEDGYTSHECSVCGDNYTTDSVSKLGHDWGEWTVKQEGNCTVNNVKERTCARCGFVDKDVTAASGHDYKKTTTKATCTEDGKDVFTCSVCGDSYESNFVSKLGHQPEDIPAVAATCTENGLTKGRKCARCEEPLVAQKEIPATGHKEKKTPAVAATCQNEGSTGGAVCENCGKVLSEASTTPKTGHKMVTEVITAATCIDSGLSKNICEYCGYSENVIVDPLGHDYQPVVKTAATCEKEGVREYRCSRCPEKQSDAEDEIIPALGHSWKEEWTVDKAPTCTTAGSKSHHCSVCGKKNDITSIPKAHKYVEKVTRTATADRAGKVTKTCSVCKNKQTVTIAKIKTATLSKKSFIYDGTAKKPTVTVKDENGKKLVNKTDYTIKYAKGRKNVGTYKVTITFKGKYEGKKVLKFNIKLAQVKGVKAAANSNRTVKLTYKKVEGAQKYIIYYSTSKNGTYKKLGTASKLTYTTPVLSRGTYYFKVKAFAKSNADKNVYGNVSAIVSATVK